MINISELINDKAKEVITKHSQMIEETIARLLVENDCKPSDIHMMIKGQLHYSFLVKKHECKTEISFNWNLEDEGN